MADELRSGSEGAMRRADGVPELAKPYTVKAVPLNPEGVHPADPNGPWPPNRTTVAEHKFATPGVQASPNFKCVECGWVGAVDPQKPACPNCTRGVDVGQGGSDGR